MCAPASAAMAISDIPWNGPVGELLLFVSRLSPCGFRKIFKLHNLVCVLLESFATLYRSS